MVKHQDAAAGIKDNDWVEVYNRNGVVQLGRGTSHKMPKGTCTCTMPRTNTLILQDQILQVNGEELIIARPKFM